MNWDKFYIDLAGHWASKSKDRSTGVGAIIVGPDNEQRSAGYNGFPRGVLDTIETRHERPAKYEYTEHAERNAIYNAARVGIPINGCVMYLNWWPLPCPDCARAIIQSGIKIVIGPDRPFVSGTKDPALDGAQPKNEPKDWQESFKASSRMFIEAGIQMRIVTMGDFNEK